MNTIFWPIRGSISLGTKTIQTPRSYHCFREESNMSMDWLENTHNKDIKLCIYKSTRTTTPLTHHSILSFPDSTLLQGWTSANCRELTQYLKEMGNIWSGLTTVDNSRCRCKSQEMENHTSMHFLNGKLPKGTSTQDVCSSFLMRVRLTNDQGNSVQF